MRFRTLTTLNALLMLLSCSPKSSAVIFPQPSSSQGPTRVFPSRPIPFAHRTNRDGTIDSICKTCFLTVGTAEEVDAFRGLESAHKCDMPLQFVTAYEHKD